MSGALSVNLTGDAALENNKVVLSGVVEFNLVMDNIEPLTEAFLWIHRSHGSTDHITAKINGVELTPIYEDISDITAATNSYQLLCSYHYTGAPISSYYTPSAWSCPGTRTAAGP